MVWIIILIAIVGLIFFAFRNDYQNNIQENIISHGGMEKKYDLLVEYLTSYPTSKISRVSDDSIEISSRTMTFFIDFVGDQTKIRLNGVIPLVGKISKNWSYPNNFPQQKIIQEIENYLEWEIDKMKNIAESDSLKYFDNND